MTELKLPEPSRVLEPENDFPSDAVFSTVKRMAMPCVRLVNEKGEFVSYVAELPWNSSSQNFFFDGRKHGDGPRRITFGEGLVAYQLTPGRSYLSHYESADASEKLTAQEFNERDTELRVGEIMPNDEDDEPVTWRSLDEEFEWKKFRAKWTPKYQQSPPELLPIDFVVTSIQIDSGDPDIVSMWRVGNADLFTRDQQTGEVVPAGKALFTVSGSLVLIKSLRKLCEEHRLQFEPSKTGDGYHKVNGSFVVTDAIKRSIQSFAGTLEECRAYKEKVWWHAMDMISPIVGARENAQLRNVPRCLATVNSALDSLNMITVVSKGSSPSNLASAKASLVALAEELRSQLRQNLGSRPGS